MKKALLYSGGVESTLLYYTLLKKAKENNYILSLFIVDRYNNPVGRAMTLYNMLRTKFDDELSTCQHLNVPSELNNTERMMYTVRELSNVYDRIYWGVNAYPPHIRPKQDQFKNLQRKLERYPQLRLPYIEHTKDWVIQEYLKYNIDWILPYTHSCGEPVDEPCGECFNCKERAWAYQKLDLDLEKGI